MMRNLMTALLLCVGSSAFAQVNHVLNPDFEQYTYCPTNYDQISASKHWSSVDSVGRISCVSDYCHTCADNLSKVNVPQGAKYWQQPHSGVAFAQVQMYYDEAFPPYPNYRDYLQSRLYKKLTAGKRYCVSFYVNLAESSGYAVKDIGAYFDNGIIDTTKTCGLPQTQYTPQVTNSGGIITDTINWVKIEGSFVANGTEYFITIGNFKDKAHTTYVKLPYTNWNNGNQFSLYIIDDVSVIDSDLPADAGPDTHVGKGDSVYIGRPKEVGLECTWSVLGSSAIIGTGAGIWVKPAAATSYVVTQTLCGTVKKDTVRVEVWAAGLHSVNGQAQQYSLSPSPGNGLIRLSQIAIDAQPVSVSMYESSGRQVYSGNASFSNGKAMLDISSLAPGFYFLQLRDGRGNAYALRYVKQ